MERRTKGSLWCVRAKRKFSRLIRPMPAGEGLIVSQAMEGKEKKCSIRQREKKSDFREEGYCEGILEIGWQQIRWATRQPGGEPSSRLRNAGALQIENSNERRARRNYPT